MRLALLAAAALAAAAPAAAAPADDLHRLMDEHYRWLLRENPTYATALGVHDYDAAIKFYRQLVKLYPHTDQAMAALATVADVYQYKLGNVQAAIEVYQQLVREFPDASETNRARLKIAHAYFELKNYDQARAEADQLIARAPVTPEAIAQIGNDFMHGVAGRTGVAAVLDQRHFRALLA